MTRLLSILILYFTSLTVAGQTNRSLFDTSSLAGQIIKTLVEDGRAGIMTDKQERTYQIYRICQRHYLQVDTLNQFLNSTEIDTLLSSDNGTLKTVGFILFCKRNNYKEAVVGKLKELLNEQYIPMLTSYCSDAISFSNLARFNYSLLTKANLFFKPSFKLTKKEKALIELDIAYYELRHSSK